jgi:hypothetical protein
MSLTARARLARGASACFFDVPPDFAIAPIMA